MWSNTRWKECSRVWCTCMIDKWFTEISNQIISWLISRDKSSWAILATVSNWLKRECKGIRRWELCVGWHPNWSLERASIQRLSIFGRLGFTQLSWLKVIHRIWMNHKRKWFKKFKMIPHLLSVTSGATSIKTSFDYACRKIRRNAHQPVNY